MLKKILLSIFSAFIIFQSADLQKVSAQDAWIYATGGIEYYVMNETAVNNSRAGHVLIDVKVKNVKQGENPEVEGIHDYHFELTEKFSRYSIDGAKEQDWWHSTKVTQNVCVYCLNFLGINVGKVLTMSDEQILDSKSEVK
ncbi:MAG: hypothetical protein IK062_07745 [Selenomonadaceae bacterium]|nr:hypothetical protein [Selenomonadaceae bacterium]